jgi:hypothetical protein
MKKSFILMALFVFGVSISQVGIGTTDPKGALDITTSNNLGVVLPRVSSIEAVTDGSSNPPVDGTMVYDTSRNSTCFYSQGKWDCIKRDASGSAYISNESQEFSDSNTTFIKAINPDTGDNFSRAIAISGDGNYLAVGAERESGNGINPNDNSVSESGAVYIYHYNGVTWQVLQYLKAPIIEANDRFGFSVSLDYDGSTLAVGSLLDDSDSSGINNDATNNNGNDIGAVHLYKRTGGTYTHQTYFKPSNPSNGDQFGGSVALSLDGKTLAVGSWREDGSANTVNGPDDDALVDVGAAYVFYNGITGWYQQAYIKPPNPDFIDRFAFYFALSGDGKTLVVSAYFEDGGAQAVNGDFNDNTASASGAAYVFERSNNEWNYTTYLKASNTNAGDYFGESIAISADGTIIAIGATIEDGGSTGVNGPDNNDVINSGAVYVFSKNYGSWQQQAYIKSPSPDSSDIFGRSVSLNGTGDKLVIGVPLEDSASNTINGDTTNNGVQDSGALFLYQRSGNCWQLKTYFKAFNPSVTDLFGINSVINTDGNVIIGGAFYEDSDSSGVTSTTNDNQPNTGAVYIYTAN